MICDDIFKSVIKRTMLKTNKSYNKYTKELNIIKGVIRMANSLVQIHIYPHLR